MNPGSEDYQALKHSNAKISKKQFKEIINENTSYTELPELMRLPPDRGRKWSPLRVATYLWELDFVKPENINWLGLNVFD